MVFSDRLLVCIALKTAMREREGKLSEGNSDPGSSSVDEILSVLDEVADFQTWAASMRMLSID